MCLLLFFFFQAEDGIRYLTVTGVQTCALPIYPVMGDDVDLLLLERSTEVDRRIIVELDAAALGRDLGGRIARTTTHALAGCPSPPDVQHGRLRVAGGSTPVPPRRCRRPRARPASR